VSTEPDVNGQPVRAPSTALALAREAGADTATRDRWIAIAAGGGDSPSLIAEFLGLSRQQVYTVLDGRRQLDDSSREEFPVEMERAWQQTESALEQLTGGEAFERLVHALLYDLDPGVRPLGGVGDRARDAIADLRSGDGSVYSISLEAQWTRKIRREVKRIVGLGYTPAFVYAITNRQTTRRAEADLEKWAADKGVRLRVLSRRWLVTKLLHPDYLALRQEALGLMPPAPKVFLSPQEYRRLLNGRPSLAGLEIQRVGTSDQVQQFLAHVRSRPATVLSGSGGIGKTRLALDAADTAGVGEMWRFLDDAVGVAANALGELSGTGEMVLVIDNAHRRQDLQVILGLLERRRPRPRVVFVVRPQRVESVEAAASAVWIGDLGDEDYFGIAPLDDFAVAELVRNPPFEVRFDGMVRTIVHLAQGNPQVAVLAAGLARDGALIPELSRAQVFERHVAGLLNSLTDRSPESRELRELLAIVAALGSLNRDDGTGIAAAASLVGPSQQAIRRWLNELADLGLLIESGGTFAIKPDLLSEHVLVSSFFPSRWQPTLSYRDVVNAFAHAHLLDLCTALGQAPLAQLNSRDPGLTALHEALRPVLNGPELESAARVLHELLPGAESLILGDFERLIQRIEQQPDLLSDAVGLRLIEATQRITQRLDVGWTLLMRLMALATSTEVSDAARKAMQDIFLRVPLNTSAQDEWILAQVQMILADATRDYASAARTGAEMTAAAAAAHALLTVMFETSAMSVEERNQIVLRAYALPASDATRRALETGIAIATSTFLARDISDQLRTVEVATALARQAAGFSGPFGLQISNQIRGVIERTVQQWDQFATQHFDELPLPTRAAILSYLVDRREFIRRSADRTNGADPEGRAQTPTAPPLPGVDDELDEFIQLIYPKTINQWTEHSNWEEEQQEQQAKCALIARRLVDGQDWFTRTGKWESWLEQTRGLYERESLGFALNGALAEAARLSPSEATRLIDHLIETRSPLRVGTGHAINYLVSQGLAQQATINRWMQGDELSRQTLAGAIASIDRPEAIAATRLLAQDESSKVKMSTLHGLRFGTSLTESRIALGLRIAEDLASIDGLSMMLMMVKARGVTLTPELASQAKAGLLATARQQHLREYHLVEVIKRLSRAAGDLAVVWSWERVNWFEQTKQQGWTIDALPDMLAPHVHQHATDADLDEALERFETIDVSLIAIDALTKLLEWIDPGSPKITEAIIRLHGALDSGPRLYRLLGLDISWDECRVRAEALAERIQPSLVMTLVDQMLPSIYTPGTFHAYVQDALDHLAAWADSSAPGVFLDGTLAAIQKLRQHPSSANELDTP
jgi:hypothetical protein